MLPTKKIPDLAKASIIGLSVFFLGFNSSNADLKGHLNGGQIVFKDIATDIDSGITYRRTESATDVSYDEIKQGGILFMENGVNIPANSRGAPGIAIFDYDEDGDMDIYVTNGPDTPNSLYSNQLNETGKLTFIDKSGEAGVSATPQDSSGVCYGDIDNDGDSDLLVLGAGSGNLLFENNGDGTFVDISHSSNIGGGTLHASSCSMGDIDNDGLIDLAIANSFPLENRLPIMSFEHDFLMEHNEIFRNTGNNYFDDVSEESGIQNIARVTWAISFIDYDQDGDSDLIVANDQGPRAPAKYGGQDKGYIRIYNNDGTGIFSDITDELGMNQFGAWMGLSFGDLNGDGHLDLFASNIGDYASVFTAPMFNFAPVIGEWHSSWFLGDKDGGFTRQTSGELVAGPFGWGASMPDYDNDGDTDIIYHGGLDVGIYMDASNSGALLNNDGNGNFSRDSIALSNSTNHARRNVRGVAVGDLDNNGFVDFVSVSNQDWPESAPMVPYPVVPLNSPFDSDSFIWPTFSQVDPGDLTEGFIWNGIEPHDGSLSVEISETVNNNNWVKVKVKGSIGLVDGAKVNRNGIGAVVQFTPKKGKSVLWPVVAGSSYASQDSNEWIFGLGHKHKGSLEVLWPGGIRNRLYNVHAGEHITIPEIPCSYDDKSTGFRTYLHCVVDSVHELHDKGSISRKFAHRLIKSAVRAYKKTH